MAVLELARSGAALAGVVSFHGLLGTSQPAEPGAIKAKVLVCTGVEDPLVPPDHVAAFVQEMRASGCDWQLHTYASAGHGFTRKDAASPGIPGIAYEPRADARSWAAMKAFLEELFAA
jgi:dienelactone hydrolase